MVQRMGLTESMSSALVCTGMAHMFRRGKSGTALHDDEGPLSDVPQSNKGRAA